MALSFSCSPEIMDDAINNQEEKRGAPARTAAAANTLCGEAYSGGQDHLLPIANVGRIMKRALPPNAKISKEAKEAVQECASEFIGFVTGEAAARCHGDNRKTVNGDDICCAMKTLGLDRYEGAMRRYLSRLKEHEEKEASANVNKVARIGVADRLSIDL